jgi:hypothetical protein
MRKKACCTRGSKIAIFATHTAKTYVPTTFATSTMDQRRKTLRRVVTFLRREERKNYGERVFGEQLLAAQYDDQEPDAVAQFRNQWHPGRIGKMGGEKTSVTRENPMERPAAKPDHARAAPGRLSSTSPSSIGWPPRRCAGQSRHAPQLSSVRRGWRSAARAEQLRTALRAVSLLARAMGADAR